MSTVCAAVVQLSSALYVNVLREAQTLFKIAHSEYCLCFFTLKLHYHHVQFSQKSATDTSNDQNKKTTSFSSFYCIYLQLMRLFRFLINVAKPDITSLRAKPCNNWCGPIKCGMKSVTSQKKMSVIWILTDSFIFKSISLKSVE